MQSDDNSSLIFIALSMLMTNNKETVIPEILYIMSPQQLTKFISMYSGETIKVPTLEEFRLTLETAIVTFSFLAEKKDFVTIFQERNINIRSQNIIQKNMMDWLANTTPETKELLFSMWQDKKRLKKNKNY